MAFKFSPGDTVCLAHPEDSGWTHRADLKKGQRGKVLDTQHENQDRLNPIIVFVNFQVSLTPGGSTNPNLNLQKNQSPSIYPLFCERSHT